MQEKTAKMQAPLLIALAVCLAIAGFFVGKASECNVAQQEHERLVTLNRNSIE